MTNPTDITGISADEYMQHYAEHFYEWVAGELIQMAPVSSTHDNLSAYLRRLLEAYFALRPVGEVKGAPFVMHLENVNSRREPDLQIILESNPGTLTDTAMRGPADICIEIVSPSNASTDYGEKFQEYERGGVREYWLIDPLRQECRFHRLNDTGHYKQILPQNDTYTTPLLPKFGLPIATLWQQPLPNFYDVGQMVNDMLKDA